MSTRCSPPPCCSWRSSSLSGWWSGRRRADARAALETRVFEKIPGYRRLKAVTGDAAPLAGQGGQRPHPALAQIEEGLCPALVMETFPDGRLLVFVPSSPAPKSGSLYIFTPDRVQLLDVPLMPFVRAVSSWGLGMRELLATAGREGLPQSPSTNISCDLSVSPQDARWRWWGSCDVDGGGPGAVWA